MKTKGLTLKEAIESGLPFKRESYTGGWLAVCPVEQKIGRLIESSDDWNLPVGSIKTTSRFSYVEDLTATDYMLKVPTVKKWRWAIESHHGAEYVTQYLSDAEAEELSVQKLIGKIESTEIEVKLS